MADGGLCCPYLCAQNAAALLLYPIVVDLSSTTEGLDRRQAVLVLMVASSALFLTPISFQTNLMGALRLPRTVAQLRSLGREA